MAAPASPDPEERGPHNKRPKPEDSSDNDQQQQQQQQPQQRPPSSYPPQQMPPQHRYPPQHYGGPPPGPNGGYNMWGGPSYNGPPLPAGYPVCIMYASEIEMLLAFFSLAPVSHAYFLSFPSTHDRCTRKEDHLLQEIVHHRTGIIVLRLDRPCRDHHSHRSLPRHKPNPMAALTIDLRHNHIQDGTLNGSIRLMDRLLLDGRVPRRNTHQVHHLQCPHRERQMDPCIHPRAAHGAVAAAVALLCEVDPSMSRMVDPNWT